MNIGIIGGGAIGLLYAFHYQLDFKVTIYTRTKEQAQLINQEGVYLQCEDKVIHQYIFATDDYADIHKQNFIIIAVKQYQLDSIYPLLNRLSEEVGLLFLQNGMGHLDYINQLPQNTIFVGTVEHGVRRNEPNNIIQSGMGVTNVAILKGKSSSKPITPESEDFPFHYHHNYEDMLWKKLLINATINPLTALLNIKNGEILENYHYHALFLQLFNEISNLMESKDPSQLLEHVINVCQSTRNNYSSMLVDMRNERQTELDAILGFAIEKGKRKGNKMILATAIYHMLKGKEKEGGLVGGWKG